MNHHRIKTCWPGHVFRQKKFARKDSGPPWHFFERCRYCPAMMETIIDHGRLPNGDIYPKVNIWLILPEGTMEVHGRIRKLKHRGFYSNKRPSEAPPPVNKGGNASDGETMREVGLSEGGPIPQGKSAESQPAVGEPPSPPLPPPPSDSGRVATDVATDAPPNLGSRPIMGSDSSGMTCA